MDWNTFGYTNKRAFLLIFNALDGKAIKQARAYYKSGGQDGKEDPEYFILFLDQGNWDGTRIARARTELTNMKMGNKQKWSVFFSAWTNKLTESQGDNWPDSSKITILKSTLNYTLHSALANSHNIPIDNFHEFTRIVSQIALQHEEMAGGPPAHQNGGNMNVNTGQRFDERSSGSLGRELVRSGREIGYVGEEDSAGDAIMGGINLAEVPRGPNGKPLRARWKTPAQIEVLRREGKCFRCERKRCRTNTCKVLPAIKPKQNGLRANAADLTRIPDGVCDEDDLVEISEN